jgi:hypothetical protein
MYLFQSVRDILKLHVTSYFNFQFDESFSEPVFVFSLASKCSAVEGTALESPGNCRQTPTGDSLGKPSTQREHVFSTRSRKLVSLGHSSKVPSLCRFSISISSLSLPDSANTRKGKGRERSSYGQQSRTWLISMIETFYASFAITVRKVQF